MPPADRTSARAAPAIPEVASRDRIVDVATRLFREKGYDMATMREIAAATGIRSSSLYHHFPGKEDILEQVMQRGIGATIARVSGAIAQVPAGRPFPERLTAAVTAHLQVVNDLNTFSIGSIWVKRLPAGVLEKYTERRREYDAIWSRLIADGIAGGDIGPGAKSGVVRLMIYGALNWSAEWVQPSRGSIEDVARLATAFILDGLAGTAGHARR